MAGKKGFTLIEIIVVMVIIGILAIIALPIYTSMMEQGMATAAINNMTVIGNAQKNYYLNYGTFVTGNISRVSNTLNTNLSLNITDSNYSYNCTLPNPNGSIFSCTATRITGGSPMVTLNGTNFTPLSTPNCMGNYCPSN